MDRRLNSAGREGAPLTARAHVLGRTTADAIKFIQDNREELEAELKQLQAEEAKKKQGASQAAKK